jgi:hypothetical protein
VEKEEFIKKGNKILLITACVIIPLLVIWLFISIVREERPTEQTVVAPQYQDFDSTVWYPRKIKNMHIEKYADHTEYLMGFEDGSRSEVYWNFFENHKIGDSVVIGETETFRRRIN